MLSFECYHTYYNWNLYEFHFLVLFPHNFLQVFISSSILYRLVVLLAKLWDDNFILVMVFLLLKLCKFRYLSFLKSSLVCKKVVLFIFISAKEGLDVAIQSSSYEQYNRHTFFKLIVWNTKNIAIIIHNFSYIHITWI